MSIVSRLTTIKTRAEATRLVVVYSLLAAAMAGGASAVEAMVLGTPMLDEALGGFVIAGLITPVLTAPLARAALELREREQRLEVQANTDCMTGTFNRRGFFAAAQLMLACPDKALCALLIDLDRFKEINDTFGHAAGDEVVTAAAAVIIAVTRPHGGVVGRLGGDEFCVLVAEMDEAGAAALGERVRGEIEARILRVAERALHITASVGVAIRKADDGAFDALLARADVSLYEAKSQGRNRAVIAGASRLRQCA